MRDIHNSSLAMSTAKRYHASQKAKDEQVRVLRDALFTNGVDKDVTAGIAPAFMKVTHCCSDAPLLLSQDISCMALCLRTFTRNNWDIYDTV